MPKQHQDSEDPAHQLFEVFSHLNNVAEIKQFLLDLCTPAELQAMTDRWWVVGPIKQGTPYRQIHADTGVSVTTIGRVARFISHGNGGYNLIHERLKKRKNVNKNQTSNRNPKKRAAQS